MLLPSDLGDKYPRLSQEDIFDAIEIATIRVSKIMLAKTVQATVEEDGLHVYSLDEGEIKEVRLKNLRRIIDRPLLEEIEKELMIRDAAAETLQYKGLRGSLVTGEIAGRTDHGDYTVYIEIAGPSTSMILAEMPRNQQCQKDFWRGSYSKGSVLSFYYCYSEAVKNINRAWVRHIVSRTNINLPVAALQKITGLDNIKCTARVPGEYCDITTRHRIPKSAINSVGKELKETLNVEITK